MITAKSRAVSRTAPRPQAGPMRFGALAAIRLYQITLSPFFRGACRHHPSCSRYAHEAIERHGARGLAMAVKRLLRCRPFGTRGYDPVP